MTHANATVVLAEDHIELPMTAALGRRVLANRLIDMGRRLDLPGFIPSRNTLFSLKSAETAGVAKTIDEEGDLTQSLPDGASARFAIAFATEETAALRDQAHDHVQ